MDGFRGAVVNVLAGLMFLLTASALLETSAHAGGKFRSTVVPAPPNLSVTVAFSEPSGNNVLDAKEKGTVSVTIRNDGAGDAFEVRATIAGPEVKGLSHPKSVAFGTVPSKESVTKVVDLTAGEDLAAGDAKVSISFEEANQFAPDPVSVTFQTKAYDPPSLVVADMAIADQGGNGKIEPMEIVELTARVQNVGGGDARRVVANVEFGPNVFPVAGTETRFDLGGLASGAHRDIKFTFYTNKAIKNGDKIPVTLKLSEANPLFSAAKPLDLVMNVPQKQVQDLVVGSRESSSQKGPVALATGLSVDVDIDIPPGLKAGEFDVAVVIGNKNYTSPGVPPVDYADRDAAIMREYLLTMFGFQPANVIYERDASSAKFNEIFGSATSHKGRLYNFVKPGVSRVFIYYVGHGAPDLNSSDGDAYFVPVDANPQYIATSGYRLQTFYENLGKIPAAGYKIVLDSCFSGNTGKGMLMKNISPALVKAKDNYAAPANATVFASASPDQVSSWYPEKGHSLFTYFFLKGLRGEADANRDRTLTASELDAYLRENVPFISRRISAVEQTPVMRGAADEVVVKLK